MLDIDLGGVLSELGLGRILVLEVLGVAGLGAIVYLVLRWLRSGDRRDDRGRTLTTPSPAHRMPQDTPPPRRRPRRLP
jgi:hypothetical protein